MTLLDKDFVLNKNDTPISSAALACLTVVLALAGCGGGGGGGGSAAPAATTPPPTSNQPVTMSLSSSANSVAAGDTVTLSWSSQNADSCTASGGWQGNRSTSGSERVGPLQSDQTFSLSCSGSNGGANGAVDVRLDNNTPVEVNLRVDSQFVRANAQVTLTWDSTAADNCQASGGWSGSQSVSGTYVTAPLTNTSDFTITCSGAGETAISSATVDVSSMRLSWAAPQLNEDGSPLNDLDGYYIRWGTENGAFPSQRRLGASATSWDYSELAGGQYYIVMTAVNTANEESETSNVLQLRVPF